MKYSVDRTKKEPSYIQLYEQLKKDIVKGNYRYGARLPSKRLISEETGVSVITAEHAYSILCDEGYAEARSRRGYFAVYRETDFLSVGEISSYGKSVQSNHHTPENTFPFSVLAKTMRRIITEERENIMIKSPNRGCTELREAISTYLARANGMSVLPEQIIIGSGAEYLYTLIVQLLGRENVFGTETPSYDKIKRVYGACGVECRQLRMGSDGIVMEDLKSTDATVLHVTPFNSFPSNVTASASKKKEYLLWAKERGGYIVEDNFDSELTVSSKAEDTLFSLDPDGSVIYVNTFSKTLAPSMRVGYMVLPHRLLEEFDAKIGFYSCTVPVFEQYTIAELINSGDFERHINRVRRERRKNRSKAKS